MLEGSEGGKERMERNEEGKQRTEVREGKDGRK